jgi:primase-polymerase (primpol)-like protein
MLGYVEGKADGIGFMLSDGGVSAVDIDDCRNPETGELHPWATDQITRSKSYAEVTPSNEGIRIIGLGKGEKLHRSSAACRMPTA